MPIMYVQYVSLLQNLLLMQQGLSDPVLYLRVTWAGRPIALHAISIPIGTEEILGNSCHT